jgi:adenylate cyclase
MRRVEPLQIHDVVRTIRAGFAVVTAVALPHSASAGVLLGVCGASVALTWLTDNFVTPLISIIIETAGLVVATSISFAVAHRRDAPVWPHLAQHLAPALVRRIPEKTRPPRLSRERREVTVLFTDVEGFTAMTHRADPEDVVAALGHYFEGMTAIIAAYGGTIDKIVGDGIHALFNAPDDLVDHPRKAVDCAIALLAWSEAFQHHPDVAPIGFGRTRIGIETGPAIVGEVGIRATLDYTAHGDVVNVAARLETANKELGSSICIGPVAASRCDPSQLRPLGSIIVRGRDEAMTVFEPGNLCKPASGGVPRAAVLPSQD